MCDSRVSQLTRGQRSAEGVGTLAAAGVRPGGATRRTTATPGGRGAAPRRGEQAASGGTPRQDAAAGTRTGAFQEVVLRPARGPAAIKRRGGADAALLRRATGSQSRPF